MKTVTSVLQGGPPDVLWRDEPGSRTVRGLGRLHDAEAKESQGRG